MKQEPNVGGTSGFEDNKTLVNHIVVSGGSGTSATTTTTAAGNVATNMSVELCLVCGDRASGRHYGAISCEGCKGFFKRSIRKQLGYQCRGTMNCEVTKHHRNRCQFCRLQKCLASGMRSDSVQHERKPIVDKKETISNTTTNTASIPSGNAKSTSPVYQQRSNKSIFNHNLNATTTSNANANAGFSLGNNMSAAGIFPMSLNFAELTQTLMLASQQQQQQQQQQQLTTQTTATTSQPPLCYSPDMKNQLEDEDDEDSMDNSSTICLQNLSNTATNNNSQNLNFNVDNLTNPANAVNMIQTSLDKRAIDKAMQLLTPIQLQLERMNVGGAATTTNNSNTNNMAGVMHIKNELDTELGCGGDVGNTIGAGECNSGEEEDNDPMDIDDPINELNTNEPFVINECIFDNELIAPNQISFILQPPNLVTSYLNIHYVCETGSRCVFISVFWLRKILAFEQLDTTTQVKLIRHAWPGLLAIALAQTRALSIKTIISTLINNISQLSEMEKIEAQKIRKLSEQTARLYGFIKEMLNMNTTDTEYALMRLALIFNPLILIQRKERLVRNFVKRVQNYTLSTLRKHTRAKLNTDIDERFNSLIMNLMPLCALDSDIMEELFFANLVGQLQIDNMIPYLLALSANAG